MKKLLFGLLLACTLFTSCDEKQEPCKCPPDSTDTASDNIVGFKTITPKDVARLHENYIKLITADPTKAVQVMNFSTPCLQKFIRRGEGGSFIMGAQDDGTLATMLEIYHDLDQSSEVYYYEDVMQGCTTGMRNRPPLCPPPNPCDMRIVTAPADGH